MDVVQNEFEPMDRSKGKWYVLQVRVALERKVQRSLESKIKNALTPVPVYEAYVPERKFLDKKKTVTRLIYPGYVYVRMDLYTDETMSEINQDAWYFVREVNGVTRFSGTPEHPLPLSDNEVKDLMKIMDSFNEEATALAPPNWLVVGARVRVEDPDCPFNNMEGRIVEVDSINAKVKLLISIFERDTPVELEFKQVEQINA